MQAPGAIVIGGYVNGLGLVRALAARDIPTAVVRTKPYDIAHCSRWACAHHAVTDLPERPEALLELLEQRAPDWRGWALFPTNDEALAALSLYRERLSSTYRVVVPEPDAVRHLLDKRLMMDVGRAAGVDVPHCYGPADEATAALPDLRFPVLVKPLVAYRFFSRFRCKLFVAADREEITRCVSALADARIPGLILDLIPGPDSQIYCYCAYLDGAGDPVAGCTVRKLRQNPPSFGDARVAELVADDPALSEASIEIARRIGLRGMAIAEFKLDPRDGRFRFLEVNGRSVVYNELLRRAGLDLGALAWCDYVCDIREHPPPTDWRGVWIHLHPDLLYSTLYRRYDPVGVADFLAPYTRPKVEAVWSARDPVPFLVQWSHTAREAGSALRHGRHRALVADRTRPPARA